MRPALTRLDGLLDLLVDAVVREIENESAPKAARPAGRKETIDDNQNSTAPEA